MPIAKPRHLGASSLNQTPASSPPSTSTLPTLAVTTIACTLTLDPCQPSIILFMLYLIVLHIMFHCLITFSMYLIIYKHVFSNLINSSIHVIKHHHTLILISSKKIIIKFSQLMTKSENSVKSFKIK